jgi:phage FluMu gp28-like protein
VPAEGLEAGQPHQWTKGVWSVHHIDIFEAVRQGCPIDIATMKEAAGDEDTWMQEYCCIFLADAQNYIPMELVVAAESEGATLELPANFTPIGALLSRLRRWTQKRSHGDVPGGEARRRVVDRCVIVMERTPFKAQREMVET